MKTFTMNGKTYKTDDETLAVLRSTIPQATVSGDMSAVAAIMILGQAAGRIVEKPFR